ncbi:sister chromatid cohesion 1 2 isoform X1 [Olea europaea subsp. europaea]|uniref:Sister chromatid cohesion 1 2 isoform X1 n=1 Tax=Olea europaea subsp. europaea TaxID=158383 RepID=A0A8S0V8L3_OLEEU|nr:sister chromatid cohesion 1 2 isoform X1 [Olea europaea subsp. europaea]
MFYSQMLLSKKGPLGTVWFAAHCHKRLKKDQVKQTDICSSVDKILLDEVPMVTYRILAYLLLGVVRIYSKKVEYLFHDCHGVVAKLSNFKVGERKGASIGGMHAPHYSITFPKRFELDAFDLEVMEDQDVIDGNVRSREDIMLADELRKEGNTVNQLGKDHHEENISFTDAYSSVYTPVRDVYSSHPVDKQLGVSPSNNKSNSVASMETFRGTEFFLEDRLDPMVLDEAENEQDHGRLSDEEREIAEEQMECPMTKLNLQEEEPHDLARSFDKNESVDAEQTRLPETVLDSRKCQRIEEFSTSIAVDVTSDSKDPGGAATPPGIMAIRTPAPKERAKVLKKRKCSFDETIAVPNKMFKQWIEDPSDLICKRKNAPHTILHAWRAHKLSNLPRTFLDPLFSCISLDLQSLECKKILPSEPIEAVEIFASQDEAVFPVTPKSQEQTPIAPATPVTHSALPRVQESRGVSDIFEPSTSNEIPEKVSSMSEDLELNVTLMDEEKDSSEDIGQEKKRLQDIYMETLLDKRDAKRML